MHPAAPGRPQQPRLLAPGLRTAALIHKNHFLFSSIQRVRSCWEEERVLSVARRGGLLRFPLRPHPRCPPPRPGPFPRPLPFLFRRPHLLPPPSPSFSSGVPELGGGAGWTWERRGRPSSLATSAGSRGGDMHGHRPPSGPRGCGRKEPTPARPAECPLPRGHGWAEGRPRPPEGSQGGLCLGNGVWEGGIYRLLFTKMRPRKTFNSSQLKEDSCAV